jgi:hypothetical protein
MNPSMLAQVVDETFPELDDSLRQEITQKVTVHFFEILKEKTFADDPSGLEQLENTLKNEADEQKRSADYGKGIVTKFLSLPKEDKIRIDGEMESELVKVLHEVYKAYE